MADNFQPGDTVILKSGGPKMTIDWVGAQFEHSTTQGAACTWFDDKNKPQHKWFPLTSLKQVVEEQQQPQPTVGRGNGGQSWMEG